MPLVLSPSFIAPSVPVSSTGPDGHLTALVDQTYDGVWLKVDYSSLKAVYPSPFRAAVYRVDPDGSTVLVRSGEVLNYSGVCYAYDHEAPLGQAVRYYVQPEWPGAAFGQSRGVLNRTGWVATASNSDGFNLPPDAIDASTSSYWTSGAAQANGMYFQVDFGQPRVFDRLVLDAGAAHASDYPRAYVVTVSTDGITWSSTIAVGFGSSQVVTVDFAQQYARYVRVTAGTSSVFWWSISDFNVYSVYGMPDQASESVAVTIPARAGGGEDPALWIKCLDDASLSLRVWATDTRSANFAGTSQTAPILGNRYPSAVIAARQAKTAPFSFYTRTMDEYDQVEELLRHNRVMIQSTQAYARRDGYFLVLDAGATRAGELATNPLMLWTAQLQEIERPPAEGDSLVVPGYSFADDDQDGDGVTPPPYATFADEGAAGSFDNIFSANASQFTESVVDWSAGANTTRSLSGTQKHSRAFSMQLLSTSSGDVSAVAAKTWNAAPLQSYTFRFWVWSPVATTGTLSLNWRNAAGASISTSTSSSLTIPANVWTQVSFNATSPALTAGVLPTVTIAATAGSQAHYVDDGELAIRTLAELGPYNQYGLTFAWAAL